MGNESRNESDVRDIGKKALVFSGTSEGKIVSCWLKKNGIDVTVSVATEYGNRDSDDDIKTHYGSYGGTEGISRELCDKGYDVVVDATHPYAVSISTHVKEACDRTGVDPIRVSRSDSTISGTEDVIYAKDIDETVSMLEDIEGPSW